MNEKSQNEQKNYIKDNKILISEWDWEKNDELGIYPDILTCGSHKKVWWKCADGHSWASIISNRARLNRGCPYCAGQKPIIGKNDLKTTHPEIAKEWNYNKNGEDAPNNYTSGSHKIVWWKCLACGQEWKAQIKSRSNGTGCPYCSTKKVAVGINDLESKYPQIAKEWHPTKNGNLTPQDFAYGSSEKVWWKCKNDHEWKAAIYNRVKGNGCPICSARRRTSFPEQAIFYYIKKAFPDAQNNYKDIFENMSMELDIYIPSKKIGIEYDGKIFHSNDKNRIRDARKYQICKKNDINLIRITDNLNSEIIINCDHKITIPQANDHYLTMAISKLLNKLNNFIYVDVAKDRMEILNYLSETDVSLQDMFPKLAEEWNYEKNKGLTPAMFHPGSNEKVWWKCSECGHEWKTSLAERTGRDKTNCPQCARKSGARKRVDTIIMLKGSIAETHTELLEEWDYDKNNISPKNVVAGSKTSVWWKCKKCGYNWKTSIEHRTKRNSKCPCCSNKVVVDGVNDLATTHPKLLNEWDYSKNIILPNQIVAGTGKKIWWKCSVCGYEWEAVVNTRAKGVGCPVCAIEKRRKNVGNCDNNSIVT